MYRTSDRHRQFTIKKLLRTGGIILFFIAILGYGTWISRDILFGISLSVEDVTDGMHTIDPLIHLSGTARHANIVTVDGRIVPIAESGIWSDTIVLLPGYNTVAISATDKFGRTKSHIYRVQYTALEKVVPQASPSPSEKVQ